MTYQGKILRLLSVLAAAVLATAAAADGVDKMPPDYAFKQSDGSPGKVTFSHGSHVDAKAPGCTRCHPKLFKTLEKGATADGQPIQHKIMEAGGQCGACHGKTAVGFDSCDFCHR
jgi:c(7)-type cytochrome triheme protein